MVFFIARSLGINPYLSIAFFFLIPLVVQGSLVFNYDNSVLMFSISLFVLAFLKFSDRLTWSSIVILSVLLAFAFWTKLNTPPVIIISLFAYFLLKERKLKALATPLAITALSMSIFLVSFFSFSLLTGYPMLRPFEHNFGSIFHAPQSFAEYVLVSIGYASLRTQLLWITPAFFILYIVAVYSCFRNYRKGKVANKTDFLIILSLLIFLEYVFVGHNLWRFPAYTAPMLPLASIIVASFILDRRSTLNHKSLALVIFALPIVFYQTFLPDFLVHTTTLNQALIIAGLGLTPLILILGLSFAFLKSMRKALVFSMLFSFISLSIYINTVHLFADYSTNYNYGESGLAEAAAFVKNNTEKPFVGHNDVAFLAGLDYQEPPANSFDCMLLKDNVDIVQLRRDWDNKYRPLFFDCMERNFEFHKFGNNFYVFLIG